jgi:hypothetical protein
MAKFKKTKIVVTLEDKEKKELQHGGSASKVSEVKSKGSVSTGLSASIDKTSGVNVSSSSSSIAQDASVSNIGSQVSGAVDLSKSGEKGNAVKDETRRTADIVVQHKFK